MRTQLFTTGLLVILSTLMGCTQVAKPPAAPEGEGGERIAAVAPIQGLSDRIEALKTHFDTTQPYVQETLAQLEDAKFDEETGEGADDDIESDEEIPDVPQE